MSPIIKKCQFRIIAFTTVFYFCIVHTSGKHWVTEDAVIFEVESTEQKSSKTESPIMPDTPLTKRELNSLLDSVAHDNMTIKIPITKTKSDLKTAITLNCVTKSEMPGICLKFQKCYPLLFNEDGELNSVGLAEVLLQNAGSCNSSSDFNLPEDEDMDSYKRDFHHQMVCCDKRTIAEPTTHPNHKGVATLATSTVNVRLLPSLDPVELSLQQFREEEENNNNHKNHHDNRIHHTEATQQSSEGKNPTNNNNNNNVPSKNDILKHTVPPYPIKLLPIVTTSSSPLPPKIVPSPDLSPWQCPGRNFFIPRGHWPWLVALLRDGNHVCSGALIDHVHVLTAAHCIYNLSAQEVGKMMVIIGDRVMYSTADGPHQWRRIVRITRHLHYNHHSLQNDIAILALDVPVDYAPNVQPISLPVTTKRSHVNKGIVLGWSGVDIAKQSFFEPRAPQEAIVKFMDIHECQRRYDGFASHISRDQICTYPSNDSCRADSGGPLLIKTKHCWHIVGIVSYGLGCGSFPEVYTDVARHIAWIQRNVKPYNYKGSRRDFLP